MRRPLHFVHPYRLFVCGLRVLYSVPLATVLDVSSMLGILSCRRRNIASVEFPSI